MVNWTTLWMTELPVLESANVELTIPNDPEVKRMEAVATQVVLPNHFQLERLEYFSGWYRAKRAVANCLKLKCVLKNCVELKKAQSESQPTVKNVKSVPILVDDLHKAEIEIIKAVQAEAFGEELKILSPLKVSGDSLERNAARKRNRCMKTTSTLYRLDPFVDKDGIIRAGGRIRRAAFSFGTKHPVILPRKHHITQLLIRHSHERIEHQGRGMTTNEIRANGFWILGCSAAVSSLFHRCIRCRKMRGSVQEQKMADLPTDRIEPALPFTYCGVDLFGPWYIKEGRKELKRCGVIFTCLVSRAIHIETANSLSTDSFINAFRRFLSLRGPIRQLISDCGSNFIGAKRELKEALAEMDQDNIKQFLLNATTLNSK